MRLPHILDWLKKHNPDVLCLQETKLNDEKFPAQEFKNLNYSSQFSGEKTYNGVAILSKVPPLKVQKQFAEEPEFAPKRFLEITIGSTHILNVYVPNGSEVGSDKFAYKLKWIDKLKEFLSKHHNPDELLIICGDFNVAPEDCDVYSPEQMKGQILFTDEEKSAIASWKSWGLLDTFRQFHKEGGHYSWWDYRMNAFKRNMGCRIDHIWATKSLAKRCKAAWIDIEPRRLERPSDHTPVIAEFIDTFNI